MNGVLALDQHFPFTITATVALMMHLRCIAEEVGDEKVDLLSQEVVRAVHAHQYDAGLNLLRCAVEPTE